MDDAAHMRSALALARRGLGNTWPNPAVGCVIVRDGMVAGRGWTAPGGRPHAETQALAAAGDRAGGATAYVTLEPCAHHGRTPPCADALIAAGIARCVIALGDPDPRVNGAGIARLRTAGVAVETGLLAAEAAALQAGFLTRLREGRPLFTLKLATSLDGRIATATGESRWITAAPARRAAHALRARHDATLVGIGTALADDPALTCRTPNMRPTPNLRIILDTHLRLPLTSTLARTARNTPVWLLHGLSPDPARHDALAAVGIRLIEVEPGIAAAAQALGAAGLTRVLVEGGASVAASLLDAGLADRLAWFHAPCLIGGDGTPALRSLGVTALARAPRFTHVASHPLGTDWLTELEAA